MAPSKGVACFFFFFTVTCTLPCCTAFYCEKADEPAPVGNYDQRKLDEEKRLETMQKQLLSLSSTVSPAQRADSRCEISKDNVQSQSAMNMGCLYSQLSHDILFSFDHV